MNTDYTGGSVAYGLKYGEFLEVDDRLRKKLFRLLARVSEQSYRRGFQQGQHFIEIGVKTVDPNKLRFDTALDRSPHTDAFDDMNRWRGRSGMSSLERLLIEYPALVELLGDAGIDIPCP